MKLTHKFPIITITIALIIISAVSCSKKETPVPANNSGASPVPVYDFKNTTAIYPTIGLGVDASGNVYVADFVENIIKMVTPAGVTTIIAGSGHLGSSNGTGSAASFNFPSGLALDAANNIYIADSGNNLIRKITSAGVVTTIAGSGTVGSANGMGVSASFSFPQGIAVDNTGNIYVADTGNDLIRKISPDGMVSTLAGKVAAGKTNGTGTQATFNIPQGVAVDNFGNVYVADAGNNIIREITPAGVVSTFAGNGYIMSTDGIGIQASFDFPNAISIDTAGDLYITDGGSNKVREINPNKNVYTLDFSN